MTLYLPAAFPNNQISLASLHSDLLLLGDDGKLYT